MKNFSTQFPNDKKNNNRSYKRQRPLLSPRKKTVEIIALFAQSYGNNITYNANNYTFALN